MSEGREQAIRERAYFLWEQEGHPRGGSISHWLRAETEAETEAEAEAAASTATGGAERSDLAETRNGDLIRKIAAVVQAVRSIGYDRDEIPAETRHEMAWLLNRLADQLRAERPRLSDNAGAEEAALEVQPSLS